MAQSMWLFVWGIRSDGPVPVKCLAWSHGGSRGGNAGRRGRYRIDEDVDDDDGPSSHPCYKWTVDEAVAWAKAYGAPETVLSALYQQQVDGRALLTLDGADVKALIPQLAPRLVFEDQVVLLRKRKAEPSNDNDNNGSSDFYAQNLSCTTYFGPTVALAAGGPLCLGKKLPKLALVTFTGVSRNNNEAGPKQPPGIPLIMVEMRNCRCTSFSTGGSGGRDRLTANVSFSGESLAYHVVGSKDFVEMTPEMFLRWIGPPAAQGVNVNLGVTFLIGKGIDTQVVEWGAHVGNSSNPFSECPFPKATKAQEAKKEDE